VLPTRLCWRTPTAAPRGGVILALVHELGASLVVAEDFIGEVEPEGHERDAVVEFVAALCVHLQVAVGIDLAVGALGAKANRVGIGCAGNQRRRNVVATDKCQYRWILLGNAFKYTSAPGHIEVVLNASNTEATILVSDTGIGIAKSDLPHIFDRFYRTDASRSQVEGSGLGLAIAKGIAEMHRGNLFVISEENKGTTFRIVFPFCDSGAGRETAGVTRHVR
jgi:hypothetical protein